ncbi:MAG: PqqD family protein [Candidatus Methanoperedens sp.]|nr:PqqD family protein [Candidatus Methanoperedens sp.]
MAETSSINSTVAVAATKPRRNPGFIWRKMGAEAVLFNPSNNETYMLNQTATVIWELCDDAHSLEDIADAIAERFDTGKGREKIFQDVVTFVTEGERSGYILISD